MRSAGWDSIARPRRSSLVALFGAVAALALIPAGARAAEVIVLGPGHRASVVDDRFLTAIPTTPGPDIPTSAASRSRSHGRRNHCMVCAVLTRLRHDGVIADAAYRRYSGMYAAALAAVRRLQGTRA